MTSAAYRWAQGRSGNPAGRSKLDFDLAQAARAHSPEMIEIVVAARDEGNPPEGQLRAVEIVLDPAHGQPIATQLLQG